MSLAVEEISLHSPSSEKRVRELRLESVELALAHDVGSGGARGASSLVDAEASVTLSAWAVYLHVEEARA